MIRIHDTYNIVKKILRDTPEARDDDGLLTFMVYERISPGVTALSFQEVMTNRAALRLPSPETVRRSRQKAQESIPGLGSSRNIKKAREDHKEAVEDIVRRTHE